MSSGFPSDLWEKFVGGDHSCFGDLFKGYYRSLYGYGLKLCSDPELVKDCLQNLFATIWEKRNELKHVTSPNVYLFVSLRRNILKEKKRKNRKKGMSGQSFGEDQMVFGIEDLLMRDESKKKQKEKLRDALNQLTNQQKEVLYLHYYNGMSYGEIEEILSINRQSVRNHMYRAIQTLRTVLDIEVMRLVVLFLLAILFFV